MVLFPATKKETVMGNMDGQLTSITYEKLLQSEQDALKPIGTTPLGTLQRFLRSADI